MAASSNEDYSALELKLHYLFTHRALLKEALTHTSHEDVLLGLSYQRLQFVGTAVLDLVLAVYLFETFETASKRNLVEMRMEAINKDRLISVAKDLKLQAHIRHRAREVLHRDFQTTPKIQADFVQSIAGAIYMDTDQNFKKTSEVIRQILKLNDPELQASFKRGMRNDPENSDAKPATPPESDVDDDTSPGETIANNVAKQELLKFCLRNHWSSPKYIVTENTNKKFTCSVEVYQPGNAEAIRATSTPKSRVKDAKKAAARSLILQFSQLN